MENLKQAAKYTLDALINGGADSAQVSVSEGKIEEFNVDAGDFSLIRSVFNSSLAAKVIKNKRKGTVSLNQLDKEAIDIAVAECLAAADASVEDDALSIATKEENCDFVDGVLVPDKSVFFDSIIKFCDDTERYYPEIMLEQLIATYSYGKHVVMNTNGVEFTEEDGAYNISVMYSAHKGDESTSFNYFDVDFLDPASDIMEFDMVRTNFERAVKELDAQSFEGKFEGVAVFAPACFGDILSTVMGSFAGDFALIEGTSPWKNSLGKEVAGKDFTLKVIPHSEKIVCGENITSDGYKSQDYCIINKGVLESFCLTEYASRKTGLKRSPSTSSCIEVTAGERSFDEIVASIDKGILVCRFSGGEPANNGDFSGVAKNSFLIENGKVTKPLTETMISGNIAAMLKNVYAISKETVCDGSSVLPYAAFNGVTVSGK